MQDEPQAALITGLFGTGKSSVAIEMADMLEQRDLPYAVIDLDWLCWGWAGGAEGSEHRMMLANLAPVVTNYLGAGVRYLILARSIRTPAGLAPDITAARHDDLRDAEAWLTAGEGVGLGDLSIPNDRPLRTVASEILGWLGWTDSA